MIVPSKVSIWVNLLDATVRCGGGVIRLTGRDLELTYCMALRERPVPRETLIEDLWPHADARDAANSFNACLHRLRKRLGRRDAICLTPLGYALGDAVITDLRALEMFRAHLAGRVDVSDYEVNLAAAAHRRLSLATTPTQIAATELGDVFERKVDRLKLEFALGLTTLSATFSETSKALEIAQEMIRVDACDESAWEIVIRARVARNERHAAIRDYRIYERNLAQELGLPPSRAIKQLVMQCAAETSPQVA